MRIASLALVVAAALSLLAATDPGSPEFEAFASDLRDIVAEKQRLSLAEATDADRAGDHYHPSGEEPGIAPPEADIALAASFEAVEAVGAAGIPDCASEGTVCAADRAGLAPGTSFHVYAGTMQAPPRPVAGKRVEFGVAAFDESPRDGRPAAAWEAIPEFRGDNFRGANVVWTLLSDNGAPYALFRLEYGPGDAGFLAAPTDAIALLRGSTWAILIPKAEWEGTVNGRLYSFRADGNDFAPLTTVVDTYPDIEEPPLPSVGRPTIVLSRPPERGPNPGLIVAGVGAALVALLGAWIVARRRSRGPRT